MSARFRVPTARALVDALNARPGHRAAVAQASGTPVFGGCGDASCCPQHSGLTHDGERVLVVTCEPRVSNTELSRMARRAEARQAAHDAAYHEAFIACGPADDAETAAVEAGRAAWACWPADLAQDRA